MFGRKASPGGPTVISRGARFEGTLTIEGGLQIDGHVKGHIVADGGVSVGPDGRIEGEVSADHLALAGHFEGTLAVQGQLHLLPTGVVRGEVRYGALQVDNGAVIEGQTHRKEDERAAPGMAVEPTELGLTETAEA